MIHYQNSRSRKNTSRFVFHTTYHDDGASTCFEVGKPTPSAEEISQRIVEETKECFRNKDVESLIRTNFRTVLKAFCKLNNNYYCYLLAKCALNNIRNRDKTSTEKDLESSQLSKSAKAHVREAILKSYPIP